MRAFTIHVKAPITDAGALTGIGPWLVRNRGGQSATTLRQGIRLGNSSNTAMMVLFVTVLAGVRGERATAEATVRRPRVLNGRRQLTQTAMKPDMCGVS